MCNVNCADHNGKRLKFTVFFTRCPQICLLSILLSRAFEDNAFEHGFRNIDELLSRPRLRKQQYIPVPFKSDRLEEPAFKMAYDSYRDFFQRVVQAAGFRDRVRPYALRVAAGNAFDGKRSLSRFLVDGWEKEMNRTDTIHPPCARIP